MAEFTPITSQEQLNAIIGERLASEKDRYQRKYAEYLSPEDVKSQTADLNKQISDLTTQLDAANKKAETDAKSLAERDSKIKAYETRSVKSRIAHESGLSYEAIEFLQGEDEESIKASAEALKKLTGLGRTPPEFKPDENLPSQSGSSAALKKLAQTLGK